MLITSFHLILRTKPFQIFIQKIFGFFIISILLIQFIIHQSMNCHCKAYCTHISIFEVKQLMYLHCIK